MAFLRTEEEVDKLIEEMMTKGKGKYITQSVVFNKKNPRHMELLKKTLMSSESFGGFMREVLSEKFSDTGITEVVKKPEPQPVETVEKKDTGNFL